MSNKSEGRRIGRPPGADADKTKAALLDAALSAFAERGFEGASIREITGDVGVGHNLVRHYFGSKEDLWRAAIRHGLEPAAQNIVEMFDVGSAPPLRPTLRAGLELLMVEAAANPDAFRLFLAEALRGGPRFEQLYDDILEPISQAIFSYAAGTDEIPPSVDLRVLGIFVFGAAFSPFTFEGMASRLGFAPPKAGEPLDAQVDQLIEMIVAGMTQIES
ncbi:TetR/AcrR family transcriptional regulator [Actinospongicola halichondriae]|uniref:TetR/AcrR family transcriptional regulator n=1 Tax=Actinospongicola halichondriae TaxID=3236844 RepID=UPI003D5C2CE5